MPKVTVYEVEVFNIMDGTILSSRMATREGAAMMRGRVLEDTATDIDVSQLEPGEQWTPRGLVP